jgi:hypothetical protein
MHMLKIAVPTVFVMFAAVPVVAQGQQTGYSAPPTTRVTDAPFDTPPAKPSAAVPMPAPVVRQSPSSTQNSAMQSDEQEYRPFTQTGGNPYVAPADTGNVVTDDINSGIVTHVASTPNEVPEGTVLKVRLRQELSTANARPGSSFLAEVTEPLLKDGQVLIPAGALMNGRITMVRSGHAFGGQPAIHLEPRTVTLGDGSHFYLRARTIDTDRYRELRVDDEGTILRREWTKKTLSALALTTGGGAAAGAMIGGVPGAVIGAGVGAGTGSVVMMKQSHEEVLPMDTEVVFSLTMPMATRPLHDSAAVREPVAMQTGQ